VKQLIRFVFVTTLTIGICQAESPRDGQERRPNIVFFMADDWSWPHAGILGDPVVKTPTFDRIAGQGVLFENAFVSTPSCTPSRLSILTGQHHWRLQEGDSLGGSLREEYDVYTEMLEKAGYRVGRFGKGVWPSKHAFRHRDSFGERFRSFDEFIEKRRSGEPFCYWHGGQDPHRPYDLQIGVKSGIKLDNIKVPGCLPDNEIVRSDLADYIWEVQRFDREAGRIVERLEAMGELENTIIVISGDNGMPFPRCKATLYDQGTRVPLAIRWGARVQGNRTISDFVSLCDLAPTFLEAAGLKPSDQMTGRSLMPILLSKGAGHIDPSRTFVLTGMERHVYSYPSRALRTKDFLYIRNFDSKHWTTGEVKGHNPKYDFATEPWPTERGDFSFNIDPSPSKQFLRLHRHDIDTKPFVDLAFSQRPHEELYDLTEDPDQLHNVAQHPGYAKDKNRLRRKLDAELIQSGDPRLAKARPNVLFIAVDDLPPEGRRRGPNRYFAHIRKHNQWRQAIQGYLASIAFADAMVGRVIDALEPRGKRKSHGSIPTGWRIRRSTQPGSVWLITDKKDRPLGYFIVGDRSALGMIPLPSDR